MCPEASVQMTPQMWIGLAFAAGLVVFLIVAFFAKDRLSEHQVYILRFLSALCAAFAGALITGDALFRVEGELSQKTKIFVQGTAGFALFFVVWLSLRQRNPTQVPDAFHFSVPEGWTFEQTAKAIARHDHAIADLEGFKAAHLAVAVESREFHTKTARDALLALRSLAGGNAIPKYTVDKDDHVYHVRVARRS
jgi:hypothetical protein